MTTATLAQAEENTLVGIIKGLQLRGKSYLDIERTTGIPAVRAQALMTQYWASKSANMDPNESRMLQMERLEVLIEPLMDMALLGNVKSAEVLIKSLDSINTLLGLNLQQTKIEIKVITDEQSEVIFRAIRAVGQALLGFVASELGEDTKAYAKIEDGWDAAIASAFNDASENIIDAEVVSE